MYVVKGELLVRREDPAALLGQFGAYYEATGTQEDGATSSNYISVVSDHERVARTAVTDLQKIGSLPASTEVEQIASLEQANKYTDAPVRMPLDLTTRRVTDLANEIDTRMPADAELLAGNAQLWNETRIPTRSVYAFALGRLLAEFAYNPDTGWQHTHDAITGKSRTLGLVTPILSLSRRRQQVSAIDYHSRSQ